MQRSLSTALIGVRQCCALCPRQWTSEWTLEMLQFLPSRASLQTLDLPWPLCQVSAAGTLSPWVPGSEALQCCCPKTTGPSVTFQTWRPWFFLRLPTPQVLSLQFPGSSCVQGILSETAWERNKCRQNNKYTCIGLPFLADRRCFGT